MMTEVETGVIKNGKDGRHPPEVRESQGRRFPAALRGTVALRTHWCWISSFQKREQINFCWVQPSSRWYFTTAATGKEHTQRDRQGRPAGV